MPEILVLLVLLYKLSVSLSHQRLLLLVAYENDKSLLFLTSFIQCCCLMLLLHALHQLRVMLQQLLGHIFLSLHFRNEELSTTGWLNNCFHSVWLPAE